ncbi:MAG: magnesium transporter [Rickettsiales bacterium]
MADKEQQSDSAASEQFVLDPELGFTLAPEFVAEVILAIDREDTSLAHELVAPLLAQDQAELFEQLSPDQRRWLTETLAAEFDSEVLAELSPEVVEDVMETLGATKSAEVIAEMETDDAVHILEDLTPEEQQELLEEMPEDIREDLEESLNYPEESAGRMMRKALVAVPKDWTVGETIDYLRAHDGLPDNFYVIYVVDVAFKPIGRLMLGTMLHHKRDVSIDSIMSDVYAVEGTTDQEEIAHMFRKYALVEAPVVNAQGTLIGTITVDDVVDVIQEEGDEDYLAAGGVSTQDFQSRLIDTVKARFGWLFVNLLTALLASMVIGQFEDSIEKIVALAVVMPIVASMGGNTGTQAVTVAVRAIATKSLTDANQWSHIRKEMLIGLFNGVALGAIMAGGAYLWFHDVMFALVLLLAAVGTMMMAGLFGALIPITLHHRGIDPAISSSIFLTTVTDCVGFLSFLGLATLILL